MKLHEHKTKIVCTIGPACGEVDVIEAMIAAGMNVARINFSHGNPEQWKRYIKNIEAAAGKCRRTIGILADLPGAKIRVGKILNEPLELKKGAQVTLTPDDATSSPSRISVEYKKLSESVRPGGAIYLADGFIELNVDEIAGADVRCTVVMGGMLTSRKGLNLPGAKLLIDRVTDEDLELVKFGLENGISIFGISFVENAADVQKVKDHAARLGKYVFAVAKIERAEAVKNITGILNAADGIMIARGDLGVETPIEEVPMIQKRLIAQANLAGKPVITATQMLESMKNNTRPTRAEVSDVANAIGDGTDAIMLSEETAVGDYPVETVKMMSSIAAFSETQKMTNCRQAELREYLKRLSDQGKLTITDVISRNAAVAADALSARYIVTPTETGGTPRRVSRFKPACRIIAFSRNENTCRSLTLSYGVWPYLFDNNGTKWHEAIMRFLCGGKMIDENDTLIIAEGRFSNKPGGTDSMEILTVSKEML